MKKFTLLFFTLFLGFSFGDTRPENLLKIMQFTRFFDDRYFGFKLNPIREIACDFGGMKIISIRNKPNCIADKKALATFEKEHKSAVERVLKPGKNYFIKILSDHGDNHFACDISTDKNNFRLVLVKAGFAEPTKNAHKLLHEAYEDAVKNKRGMFSAKFEKTTECILGEIPKFDDKKDDKKSK